MQRSLQSLSVLLVVTAAAAHAHPTHTQVTEVEWNAETGRFEVAMRLDAAALEDSLTAKRGQRMRLESMSDVDDVLSHWLPQRFRITTPQFTTGKIRWAGHELELHTVWLYFEYIPETPAPNSLTPVADQIRVENRCLMKVRPESEHYVQLRDGRALRSGHCTRLKPVTTVREKTHPARFERSSDFSLTDPR